MFLTEMPSLVAKGRHKLIIYGISVDFRLYTVFVNVFVYLGWDPGVLQEGVPRQGHHQHCGGQPRHQDWKLVQAGQEEVPEPAHVGQAIQVAIHFLKFAHHFN